MKDPTKQARVRKRLLSKVNRSLLTARNDVVHLIGGLTTNLQATEYTTTPQTIEQLQLNIDAIMNLAILGSIAGEVIVPDWEYTPEIEQPYRTATAETVNETNRLIDAATIAGIYRLAIPPRKLSVEEVRLSPNYKNLMEQGKRRAFNTFKDFSRKISADINRTINEGMRAGKTRTAIIDDVKNRFKISKGSAKRIVNTEVSKAYNDGRIDAARLLEKTTGQTIRVRHMSALLPTTRDSHAARDNNIYTMDEQVAWWDEGVNRINCYCVTRPVLIDEKGDAINV